MRKIGGTLLAVAIATAGVIGLIAFFNARDESTTGGEQASTPTTTATIPAPAESGALLEAGNVVLQFSDPAFAPQLKALAESLGAPDTPETRAAGQAVVLRRDPKIGGVAARGSRAGLNVADPSDPRLQDFIERSLGQGSAG